MRKIGLLLAAIAISAPLALGQTVYRPSTYEDSGNFRTANAPYAYDGNISTFAGVVGFITDGVSYMDFCRWSGFPSYTSSEPLTLNVTFSVPQATNAYFNIRIDVSGGDKRVFNYTSPTTETTVQWTVPAGTNLDTIGVSGEAYGLPPSGNAAGYVYEIWIE